MSDPIDPGVDIGHVHLKVADLDRAVAFYRDVLGFELQRSWERGPPSSPPAATTTTSASTPGTARGGSPPPPGTTGLFHFAIRYPSRAALGRAVKRVLEAGVELEGASDHGVSEAVYLHDPDLNGIELYWDRPRDQWPRSSSGEGVEMGTATTRPRRARRGRGLGIVTARPA